MSKAKFQFEDGGPKVGIDVRKNSCLGIHRSFDEKGFVLTHLPTQRCVVRTRLKREAIALRKKLDALDWTDPQAIRFEVEAIIDEAVKG